jgi:hypothetical protein
VTLLDIYHTLNALNAEPVTPEEAKEEAVDGNR